MSMSTTTTRIPQVGELWLVHYPYRTPGGYEKTRPGIIVGFGEGDEVYVRKITTKNKKGNRPFLHPKLKKQSFQSRQEKTLIHGWKKDELKNKAEDIQPIENEEVSTTEEVESADYTEYNKVARKLEEYLSNSK
mgnify:CR=1 FL=1